MKTISNFQKWLHVISQSDSVYNASFNDQSRMIEFSYKPDSPKLPFTPAYSLHMKDAMVFIGIFLPFPMPKGVFQNLVSLVNTHPDDDPYTPKFVYNKKSRLARVQLRISETDDINEDMFLSYTDALAINAMSCLRAYDKLVSATATLCSAITAIADLSCKKALADDEEDNSWDDSWDEWDNDRDQDDDDDDDSDDTDEEYFDDDDDFDDNDGDNSSSDDDPGRFCYGNGSGCRIDDDDRVYRSVPRRPYPRGDRRYRGF